MATVDRDATRRKTPWVVRWRDEAGKQRKRGFARKVDADRWRAEVEHSLNVGAYVDPAAGRVTLRAYAESWRSAQPHRPNTAARTLSQLTKHVYPVLGSRPLVAIRPSEVQAFVAGLALAPGSVRTVFATLRAILAAAVRDRAIGHDPCERIKLPAVERKRIVPLSVGQVDALADAVPPECRAMVEVDAGTGLRQGELFGLQVADVDFLRRAVHVRRQVQPARGGGYVVCPVKNKAGVRTVPIGDVTTIALAEHLREHPAVGEAFIFRTAAGEPWTRATFNRPVWNPARKRAGLPGVGFHDLRHFYASALIRAGLSVKVVSERLGHANAAMTLNTYAHLWPDDEDRTRAAIDELFRRDVPTVRPAEGRFT